MSANFFLDNDDLRFRLEHLDLREVVDLKEHGYAHADAYPSSSPHAPARPTRRAPTTSTAR
jgi:hypothetical protein